MLAEWGGEAGQDVSETPCKFGKYAPLMKSVHNGSMRTRANIHLDADAYSFASAYASAKGMPLGAAVSELLRQRAEQNRDTPPSVSRRLTRTAHGLLVKARTGRTLTPEMVSESSEDDPA